MKLFEIYKYNGPINWFIFQVDGDTVEQGPASISDIEKITRKVATYTDTDVSDLETVHESDGIYIMLDDTAYAILGDKSQLEEYI